MRKLLCYFLGHVSPPFYAHITNVTIMESVAVAFGLPDLICLRCAAPLLIAAKPDASMLMTSRTEDSARAFAADINARHDGSWAIPRKDDVFGWMVDMGFSEPRSGKVDSPPVPGLDAQTLADRWG
jgi:hypothetical protein